MRLSFALLSAVWAASVAAAFSAHSYECPFTVEEVTRVTFAGGKSQTARDNARCICVDSSGTAHMVWEDMRTGDFEIYYAAISEDTLLPDIRITHSRSESSYPCVACDSENVYILWQEFVDKDFEIYYVRLKHGREMARKRITHTVLESACPVAAVGPDGSLHIAWHEGPFKLTGVYYGRIVGDSLVEKQEICTTGLEAFRPDIACDSEGRILIAWFEGLNMRSRYWDGTSWGDEQLVATNDARPWRLSLANISDDNWALTWFDGSPEGYDILIKFFDGKRWHGDARVNTGRLGYYPNVTGLGDGELAVVWEARDMEKDEYSLRLRCHNGRTWSDPLEIYRSKVMGRYASLATYRSSLHTVWFSAKEGNNEIFHARLRGHR
jgi:hypothetical protein